jgi:hypothetical protein
LAGLSPVASSPFFLTSLWSRKELCTTGSGNTIIDDPGFFRAK